MVAALKRKAGRKKEATVISIGSIDYTLLLSITLLLLIGIAMIGSSSIYIAEKDFGDMFYFFKRQSIIAAASFAIMIFMSNFNYRYLMQFVMPLYLVSNVLLVVVKLFGLTAYGAARWIQLPIIGRFQPSELSKIAIILLVSYAIHKNKNILKTWGGFLLLSGLVSLTVGLVLLGGLSSAIIVAVIGFGTIFIASPHIMRFIVMGGMGVAGVIAIISMPNFRIERVLAWRNPYDYQSSTGYQIIQSLYAIASGGPFGLGIGQSRQRSFLPFPHNDFIFSIICEELGLVGAALVLILFGILIWRGINIAIKAPDTFGTLIAAGIVLMIGAQVIINVAVVTNSIPNTGVTMPLVSYGGTSLLITMFLLGVLLNISRHSRER